MCSTFHPMCYTSLLFGLNGIYALILDEYLFGIHAVMVLYISTLNHCYMSNDNTNQFVLWMDRLFASTLLFHSLYLSIFYMNRYTVIAIMFGILTSRIYFTKIYCQIHYHPRYIHHILFHLFGNIALSLFIYGIHLYHNRSL